MSRDMMRKVAGAAALLLAGVAAPASAQDGYLFGPPDGHLSIRAGYARPGASSDLFAESFEMFTLKKSSFSAPDLGAEIGVRLTPRLDLIFGAEYAGRSTTSAYRDFEDNDDQPIEQSTTFQRVPLTVGVKAYLLPPGRAIGRLAWIPAAVTPWVGGAVGTTWYRFVQQGDFVSITPGSPEMPIYSDRLESKGWGLAWQGMGGVDVTVSPRMAITTDIRYTKSQASLDTRSFSGYQNIDLSGASVALGLTFRL